MLELAETVKGSGKKKTGEDLAWRDVTDRPTDEARS